MCRGWRKEMGGGGLVELWPSKTHGATRAIVIDPVIMGTGGITWPSCWWRNCLGGLMEKRFRGGSILAVITPTLAPVVPGWSTVAVRATSAGTAHSANCLRCFWRHVDRIWSHTNTPNNPQPLATVQRKAQSMDCRLLDLQRKFSGLLKLNQRLAWEKTRWRLFVLGRSRSQRRLKKTSSFRRNPVELILQSITKLAMGYRGIRLFF
jgi:hypothetical protein